MALKALLLRKKLDAVQRALEELRAKDVDFQEREAELESAINEAESEEDRTDVADLVSEFETEKQGHETKKNDLSAQLEQLERDLAEEEAKQPAPVPAADQGSAAPASIGERKDEVIMHMEERSFFGLTRQQRDAFLAREEIKDFLQRVRAMGKEERAISGAELTIPGHMLDLIRENISKYSKLISKVRLRPVPGKARQNIMGTVPEAVWTEACATLNELSLSFNQVEVDGYKVGGFIAICNATLEDSDLALAREIMDALGQAIGYAVDKAICYGTGRKMPTGIATRLAQTTKPTDWNEKSPEWKDLSTTNLIAISGKTGVNLYQEIILKAGVVKDTYSRSNLTWVMNTSTKSMLTAQALGFNAAGAIVTGLNNTMPVIGGDIVTLDFVPVGDVIVGYFDLYLLAERAGAQLAQSEHARFIEDQTVFKGTARYDGMPVFGEAFAVMNINGEAPATTATFPPDKANSTEENPS